VVQGFSEKYKILILLFKNTNFQDLKKASISNFSVKNMWWEVSAHLIGLIVSTHLPSFSGLTLLLDMGC